MAVVVCQWMLIACATQGGIRSNDTKAPALANSQFDAVNVSICLDSSGKLSRPPLISRSSGNQRLDAAALRYVEATSGHWKVGQKNGRPIPYCGVYPVRFGQTDLTTYTVLLAPQRANGIGRDGTLTERPTTVRSSGSQALDDAALRYGYQVSRNMKPESIGGEPVGYCSVLLVRFALTSGKAR